MSLPVHGRPHDEILATLRAMRAVDVPWRAGRLYAGIYDPGPEAEAVIKAAYSEFLTENALYPNYYPSLLQLEATIVGSLKELLRAPERAAGSCTSGGTESILLAVKTARDKARAERPQVTTPTIVLPRTAHPAFHKAAHLLGLALRIVEVDPATFRADPAAMAAAIDDQTVLVVASAPCYSHGVVDPVPEIAAAAAARGIPCHVDACVGGIHLSVMRLAGMDVPEFDLHLPGVSTLSVDMHKYGYAAKNISLLLYRDRELRRYGMYSNARTTGYALINSGILSTRSGGPLAGAWATLQHFGQAGYINLVTAVMESTHRLIDGIGQIPGLRVLSKPDMCMFAVASDEVSVFLIDDAMSRRGWALQPQFAIGGSPANLHISVNHGNIGQEDAFLSDLRAAMEEARADGSLGDPGDLQAEVERIMAAPGPDSFAQIAALAGITPGSMPSSFAQINTVLNALPDPIVEQLLIEYLNSIYA